MKVSELIKKIKLKPFPGKTKKDTLTPSIPVPVDPREKDK